MTAGLVAAVESAARRPLAAWDRFWFTPRPASTYVVWRGALGFTATAWLVSLAWDLQTFYGEDGIRPSPSYADHRLGLFQWWESDTALWTVYLVSLAAAVAVTVGRFVRVAAPVLFLGVLSFQFDNTSVLNAGDNLLRIWCAYLALFALVTPARVLDVHWRPGRGSTPVAPTWLLRLAQIQLTIIYPASVIAKLDGDTWVDGTAALWTFGLEDFARFPVPGVLTESVTFGAVTTYGTLALEWALPFLLWTRRTRRFGIVAGLALHLSFDYTMRLGFFAWVMAIGYIAFLTPSESARILGWLRRPFRRSRPQVDDRPPPDHEPAPSVPVAATVADHAGVGAEGEPGDGTQRG